MVDGITLGNVQKVGIQFYDYCSSVQQDITLSGVTFENNCNGVNEGGYSRSAVVSNGAANPGSTLTITGCSFDEPGAGIDFIRTTNAMVDASGNYWGGMELDGILAKIQGNAAIETYYTDAAMTTPSEGFTGVLVNNVAGLTYAIANAKDGDTITLAEGTYDVGSNYFVGKQVNLVGAGPDKTVIEGSIFLTQTVGDMSISDLKMLSGGGHVALNFQGHSNDNAYQLDGAVLTVSNCVFEDYQYTIGVNSRVKNSQLVIKGCQFVDCGCAAAVQTGLNNTVSYENTVIDSGFATQSFGNDSEGAFYNDFYYSQDADLTAEPDLDAVETPITIITQVNPDPAGTLRGASSGVVMFTGGEYDLGPVNVANPVSILGAGAGKTVLKGQIGYTTSASDQDISVSGLTMQATAAGANQGIGFSALQSSEISISNCAFNGYQFGIGVNSNAAGNNLTVSDTAFTATGCAAGVKQGTAQNKVSFSNVTMDGGYAIQSFAPPAAGESSYSFNGYYKTYENYVADLEDGVLDSPDLDANDGTAKTIFVTPSMDLAATANGANPGDTLVLSAGIYNLSDVASITKRVNLVGAGTDKTTIVGPVQYLFSEDQNDAGLTVSGITFKAGSNAVQGLRFRGDGPNGGYNVKLTVEDCAFEGWTYGITMNSHANGYALTVDGCDFSESFYAVSYNYDVTTEGQEADNSLTFGEGNTLPVNGFAVQQFNNSAVPAEMVNDSYATVEEFVSGTPTVSGQVCYVTTADELASAISTAADGALIVLAPGDYGTANLTFGGKSLTIRAQYPAYEDGDKTAESTWSKFGGTFNTFGESAGDFQADQTIVIEGIAFYGDGLKVGNNSYNSVGTLEVRNCTMVMGKNLTSGVDKYNQYNYFVKTSGDDGQGGDSFAKVTVEDNYIEGTPDALVTPIQLWRVSQAIVRNNVIVLNNAEDHQAVSISKMAADADIQVDRNAISGAGGGIYVTNWLLDGGKQEGSGWTDDSDLTFTGAVSITDNVLTGAGTDTMHPIFVGPEADNQASLGEESGLSFTGNTNNGQAVEPVLGMKSDEEEPPVTLYTAIFMDGESEVDYFSGTPDEDGLEVIMPEAPDKEGYTFLGWSDGENLFNAGVTVTITGDMTFTAKWQADAPVGGGGGGGVATYAVNVADAANGTVTVNPKLASQATQVTITVKPDAGYELASVTVTGTNGAVEVTKVSDTQYTFKMPGCAVTITAVFQLQGGGRRGGEPSCPSPTWRRTPGTTTLWCSCTTRA